MSTLTAPIVRESPDAPATPQPVIVAPVAARPCRWHLWILLGITLLGAILRFSFLEKPPLWGDDAYTVYRTHSDYQAMLDILQDDGFTPLHYQLYWLMARVDPQVSVTTVRLLPAFWGTLMPPAIYLLASFLVRRRTALAAALFAALSAYLLGYSRDGKMYMMLWSTTALSTGCLLWWFKSGKRIAWLSWLAAASVMASAHMTGVAVLVFHVIFFLTKARIHWREAVLFLIGMLVAASGPAAYMTQFSRFVQQEVEDFGFEVEGLGWVVPYNAGRTGADLVNYAASAYLTGWETPKATDDGKVEPWILGSLKASAAIFLLMAAVGMLPWSRRLRGLGPTDGKKGISGADILVCPEPPSQQSEPYSNSVATRGELKALTAFDSVAAITGDTGRAGQAQRLKGDFSPEKWWRVFLWLGLWLVVPVYFIYCRSVIEFAPPSLWWDELSQLLAGPTWTAGGVVSGWFWFWMILLSTGAAAAIFLSPRVRRAMVGVILIFALLLLVVSLLRAGAPPKPNAANLSASAWPGWILYFLGPLRQWGNIMTEPLVLTAIAVLLPGLVLFYCGRNALDRLIRVTLFSLIVGIIYGACWITYHVNLSKLAKEVGQTFEKEIAAAVQTSRPLTPQLEEAARLIEEQGYLGAYRAIMSPDSSTPQTAIHSQLRTRVEAMKQQFIRPGGVWQSIFMPRYFGFIWPAFCIALIALYMRLPTRGVRIAAMTLLIGVNLGQFSQRIFAGTEPPLQHVAREVWQHDTTHNRGIAQLALLPEDLEQLPKRPAAGDVANLLHYAILGGDSTGRVYVNDGSLGGAGHPGAGTLQGQQGKYYLGFERGFYMHPSEWKRTDSTRHFDIYPAGGRRGGSGLNYDAIATEIRRAPELRRVIVWDKFFSNAPPVDRLSPLLGSEWKLMHEKEYTVRFHWTWAELYLYKRFEYARQQ